MVTKSLMKEQVCKECGTILKKEEYRTECDQCGKEIPYNLDDNVFELTFFYPVDKDNRPLTKDFCNWKCLKEWMIAHRKELEESKLGKDKIDFFTLPMITEKDVKGFLATFLWRI